MRQVSVSPHFRCTCRLRARSRLVWPSGQVSDSPHHAHFTPRDPRSLAVARASPHAKSPSNTPPVATPRRSKRKPNGVWVVTPKAEARASGPPPYEVADCDAGESVVPGGATWEACYVTACKRAPSGWVVDVFISSDGGEYQDVPSRFVRPRDQHTPTSDTEPHALEGGAKDESADAATAVDQVSAPPSVPEPEYTSPLLMVCRNQTQPSARNQTQPSPRKRAKRKLKASEVVSTLLTVGTA